MDIDRIGKNNKKDEISEEQAREIRIARKRKLKRKRHKLRMRALEKKLLGEYLPEFDLAVFTEMTHNKGKRDLITTIGRGAQKKGAKVFQCHRKKTDVSCLVALIFSYVNKITDNPKVRHNFRDKIVKTQQNLSRFNLFVDSDATACYNKNDYQHFYVRLSLNSIYPNQANYLWNPEKGEDLLRGLQRWNKMCAQKEITVKPWYNGKEEDAILICHQSNKGFLMGEKNPLQWLTETILSIRRKTDRKIVIRVPQNANGLVKTFDQPVFTPSQNIEFSEGNTLIEDVANK